MKRVKRVSYRLLYTIIMILLFMIAGVSVYAYNSNPADPPVMGHSYGEISPPTGCASGQTVMWNGASWTCSFNPPGADSRFTIDQKGLCYTAPASCASPITQPCSWFYTIEGYYCNEAFNYDNECESWCDSNRPADACVGDTTSCSGGTTSTFSWASGSCNVLYQDGSGDSINCACYGNNYQLEQVVPAGERCF